MPCITNTICLYLRVDPATLARPDASELLRKVAEISLNKVEGDATEVPLDGKYGKLLIYKGPNGSHASIRVYDEGLITVDVQFLLDPQTAQTIEMGNEDVKCVFVYGGIKKGRSEPLPQSNGVGLQLSEEYIRGVEEKLQETMGELCKEVNSLYAPIKRGGAVWPYAVTADERVMELDYDACLVDVRSRWQQVRIMHSRRHGNVLLLDGDLMLGESDQIYTLTVTGIGRHDYRDKEVLILGGGDGGILYELLKEKPKFVTMAEIDDEVIKACRQHMRGACQDAMDNYEGPHHKILVTDCVQFLHQCIQEGKQFDYVINDLTEFPVDKAVKGHGYDFETTSIITEMSVKAVKPDGLLLARGNCMTAYDYRKAIEKDIVTMGCNFLRKEAFVPSFEENYCFYEIWRRGEKAPPPLEGAFTSAST